MNEISHTGKIVGLTPEMITVEIVSSSACSSCHAKGLCGMSDETRKQVSVPAVPGEIHTVGQEVNVLLKQSMGLKAVLLSYAVPAVILLALVTVLSLILESELAAGLLSVAGVGVYYLVLLLFRKRLSGEYVFYIEPVRK